MPKEIEPNYNQENKSFLESRVFKGGLVIAVAGWLVSSAALITIGFGAMGGAWATAK